jgi:predicted RNase H-like HicB family nuclease
MRYTAIYEKSRTGWGAYLPDVPGCIATGRTVKRRIREAVVLHLRGMREDGERIPHPSTQADQVDVEDAAKLLLRLTRRNLGT